MFSERFIQVEKMDSTSINGFEIYCYRSVLNIYTEVSNSIVVRLILLSALFGANFFLTYSFCGVQLAVSN